MADEGSSRTSSRRTLLKSVPAAGAYLALSELAASPAAASTGDSPPQLGEFSDGLDGWTTTGGNELTRVDDEEMPIAVKAGTHALAVEVNGDLHPMIENKKHVRGTDFTGTSHLVAHVVGFAEETDSDMVFRFRLHHTNAPPDGAGNGNDGGNSDRGNDRGNSNSGGNGNENAGGNGNGGGNGGSKDVLVAESEAMRVAQLDSQYLRWDLRELDGEVLETANRLEIVWYLDDHEPDRGHRGRANGEFEYHGVVAVDDIRLTDDTAREEAKASREKKRSLHREHGMIVERRFEERTAELERGVLVFGDGTEIPFEFEVLDDGTFRYTVEGETFHLGGEER